VQEYSATIIFQHKLAIEATERKSSHAAHTTCTIFDTAQVRAKHEKRRRRRGRVQRLVRQSIIGLSKALNRIMEQRQSIAL
jgi:hypothetical protein